MIKGITFLNAAPFLFFNDKDTRHVFDYNPEYFAIDHWTKISGN